MIECPVCGAILQTHLRVQDVPGKSENTVSISIFEYDREDKLGFQNTLLRAILDYWRWCAECKPTDQHYYDGYHNHIAFDNGVYTYRIQVYDSPNGDTWVEGSCQIQGNKIHIINHSTEKRR
jgi:hypothetical protein